MALPNSSDEPRATPALQLRTLFILNGAGRILKVREPEPASPAPAFVLIRGLSGCAWATRADVADDIARELDKTARQEPAVADFTQPPVYADHYISLVGGEVRAGPSFEFLQRIPHLDDNLTADNERQARMPPTAGTGGPQSAGIRIVDDERLLQRYFRGWRQGEIAEGRSPVMAIAEDGYPVSICFCARRTVEAAEAGLETASAFRGRGYGPRVTSAWASAVRLSGRIPLYSTSWDNAASLAVARKLGLNMYAAEWSLDT